MSWRKNAFVRAARVALPLGLVVIAVGLAGCTATDPTKNANLVNGKKLFVQKCGACHQLQRAGTKGVTGPNLDAAFQVARNENWGDESIAGAVYGQIGYPGRGNGMPADIVTGDDAKDVAAYVADVAAVPGKDQGLLAEAVPTQGAKKTAVAKNGVLTIEADPNGLLAYVETTATAKPGPIKLVMPNKSSVPHNVEIEGTGIKTAVVTGKTAEASGTLKAGEYVYFCDVPGHRAGGMVGKLTVK